MKSKPQVIPTEGWILVAHEEDPATGIKRRSGPLYICWHEVFSRKKAALEFARKNNWQPGYRAVRGQLAAMP